MVQSRAAFSGAEQAACLWVLRIECVVEENVLRGEAEADQAHLLVVPKSACGLDQEILLRTVELLTANLPMPNDEVERVPEGHVAASDAWAIAEMLVDKSGDHQK